eukprot:TRINITY_DN1372_c0_g2_i18.p1 TRINITY_DN1372_c0_g2~~TRINITY_DN1372_c0_g2_i18.p1  ORF type:complete len:421 (+),score=65.86 TRINITY_DN1372_c0_g2_i18:206-1468(+)
MFVLFLFALGFVRGTEITCEWNGKRGFTDYNMTCASLSNTDTNVKVKLTNLPETSPTAPSFKLDYLEMYPVFYSTPVPRSLTRRTTTLARIASFELNQQSNLRKDLVTLAQQKISIAAQYQTDLLVFPETYFIGPYVESCDTNVTKCLQWQTETLDFCSSQSKTNKMWLVCTLWTWNYDDESSKFKKFNSAFVFNRNGDNLGSFEKLFPVFEMTYGIENEQTYPGEKGVKIWDTDFGMRMCILICNDISFPELIQQCSSLGADLLVWPAAWKGGRILSALALTKNIWVVNAPGPADFGKAYFSDNIGREIRQSQFLYLDNNLKIVEMETEQVAIHHNFAGRLGQMLSENAGDVRLETSWEETEIQVLVPHSPGFPVRALLRKYNLPTLRELSVWMRKHINQLRMQGKPVPKDQPLFPSNP